MRPLNLRPFTRLTRIVLVLVAGLMFSAGAAKALSLPAELARMLLLAGVALILVSTLARMATLGLLFRLVGNRRMMLFSFGVVAILITAIIVTRTFATGP